MIRLNGFAERWFAGAGALGFDGLDGGHPPLVRAYKFPFRLTGLLDPRRFTVISKTVTLDPRKGNQTDWTFWRCARVLFPLRWRSMVNSVALSNPGIDTWIQTYYPRAMKHDIRLVLSLHIEDAQEAQTLGRLVQRECRDLAGVEVNSFCPNSPPGSAEFPEEEQVRSFVEIVEEFQSQCDLPLLVKYGYYQPWEALCRALEGRLVGNELINAIPWSRLSHNGPSPLSGYGYDGSVSGGEIVYHAREACRRYVALGLKTPLLSGGGVVAHPDVGGTDRPATWTSLEKEVTTRLQAGADAVAFSTAFLWNPVEPGRVVKKLDALAADLDRARILKEVTA